MKDNYQPISSYVGLGLAVITLTAHICFKLMRIADAGTGMLLSLANALLLVFTLLWSVMGFIELHTLLKFNKCTKAEFNNGHTHHDEYVKKSTRLKYCFTINVSYLLLVLCQLGYVIFNWDEVDV